MDHVLTLTSGGVGGGYDKTSRLWAQRAWGALNGSTGLTETL